MLAIAESFSIRPRMSAPLTVTLAKVEAGFKGEYRDAVKKYSPSGTPKSSKVCPISDWLSGKYKVEIRVLSGMDPRETEMDEGGLEVSIGIIAFPEIVGPGS